MLGAGAGNSVPCLDQSLVGGVSIQCQYQQKEVYPNQVCMGNDCMYVCICIPCHSCLERYSDPKLCILQTQFKRANNHIKYKV